MKKRWSKEEEILLIKIYLDKGAKHVSEKLGRTICSVKEKARRIGLINYVPQKWSEEEIAFLKNNYSEKGCKYVCENLNRGRGSVSKKAKDFNLKVKYSPTFTKKELEKTVKESYCISNLIDNLGKTKSGTYVKIIKKYLIYYNIDTSHFDPYKKNKENLINGIKKFPMSHWLQYGSKIGSSSLKEKLYEEGLKKRICEKCGQGESWNGDHMSLILDHINGDPKDNQLKNLRILCPNCNATLPTHCRGHKPKEKQKYFCSCGKEITNRSKQCLPCSNKTNNKAYSQRKVERPSYQQLLQEIKEFGYSGTGRKYKVSDNSIRKWVKFYENT